MTKNRLQFTKFGYLVPYKIFGLYFKMLNAIAKRLYGENADQLSHRLSKNILVANTAHLGDLVLSSSVIPIIRKKYPKAKIYLLVGSWSIKVAESIPGVDGVLHYRHWKLNRDEISRIRKFFHYLYDLRKIIGEIKIREIDIAIDLYPYYPNASFLLYLGNVKRRVGFATGGFEFLYSKSFPYFDSDQHVASRYIPLLNEIGLEGLDEADFKPSLTREFSVPDPGRNDGAIVVIHPGSGDKNKLWPFEKWADLITQIQKKFPQIKFVFTGATQSEILLAERLSNFAKNRENLAGKLNWDEFCNVVSRASLLIGVDSVAGHVASAYSVPVIVIAAGMSNVSHWKPLGTSVEVLTKKLSCSPCYKGRGCDQMKCIRGIEVSEVLNKINLYLVR